MLFENSITDEDVVHIIDDLEGLDLEEDLEEYSDEEDHSCYISKLKTILKRENGISLKQFGMYNYEIDYISFSHDSTKIACSSLQRDESTEYDKIILWDLFKNDQPSVINSLTNVSSMKWSLYDNTFSTIYYNDTITFWDLETGENLFQIGDDNDNVYLAYKWTKDLSLVSTVSSDSTLYIYNSKTYECLHQIKKIGLYLLKWSPNNLFIATNNDDEDETYIWDVKTGERIYFLNDTNSNFQSFSWSPDSSLVATIDIFNETIYLIDYLQNKSFKLGGDENFVWTTSFSPDGKILASGGENLIFFWNTLNRECIRIFESSIDNIFMILWNPNNITFSTINSYGSIQVWNTITGKSINLLEKKTSEEEPIVTMKWSPDGLILASSNNEDAILMWQFFVNERMIILYIQLLKNYILIKQKMKLKLPPELWHLIFTEFINI